MVIFKQNCQLSLTWWSPLYHKTTQSFDECWHLCSVHAVSIHDCNYMYCNYVNGVHELSTCRQPLNIEYFSANLIVRKIKFDYSVCRYIEFSSSAIYSTEFIQSKVYISSCDVFDLNNVTYNCNNEMQTSSMQDCWTIPVQIGLNICINIVSLHLLTGIYICIYF